MNTPTEIIKFLQNYNAWRRGDKTLEMPHPAEIGAHIQDAVVILREYKKLTTRAERAETEVDELKESILVQQIFSDDRQRAECAEAELAALTAERDLLRAEVERCNDIINRASVQFFHDGTDGETAAKMLTVLNEAKP